MDEIDGVIRDCIGGVEFSFRVLPRFASFGESYQMIRIKEAFGTDQGSVKFFEAVLGRIGCAEVPFSRNEGTVASGFQGLANGLGVRGHYSAVAGLAKIVGGHVAEANPVGVLPGENGGPGGATATCIIKLGQPNSIVSEGIEIGGLDFTTEASEVTEAEIIGQNVENVGWFGLG